MKKYNKNNIINNIEEKSIIYLKNIEKINKNNYNNMITKAFNIGVEIY